MGEGDDSRNGHHRSKKHRSKSKDRSGSSKDRSRERRHRSGKHDGSKKDGSRSDSKGRRGHHRRGDRRKDSPSKNEAEVNHVVEPTIVVAKNDGGDEESAMDNTNSLTSSQRKKMLCLLGVFLLLAAGGGVAAFFLLRKEESDSAKPTSPNKPTLQPTQEPTTIASAKCLDDFFADSFYSERIETDILFDDPGVSAACSFASDTNTVTCNWGQSWLSNPDACSNVDGRQYMAEMTFCREDFNPDQFGDGIAYDYVYFNIPMCYPPSCTDDASILDVYRRLWQDGKVPEGNGGTPLFLSLNKTVTGSCD